MATKTATKTTRTSNRSKNTAKMKVCSVCQKRRPRTTEWFYRPDRDCRCKKCNSTYAKALKERKQKEAESKKRKTKKAK